MANNQAEGDSEPRGFFGLVASGQGFVAALGALPAVNGGSELLSLGVRPSRVDEPYHK